MQNLSRMAEGVTALLAWPPAVTLLAALGLMFLVWLAGLIRHDVSIIDIFWGPGFVLTAWLYAVLTDATTTRKWIAVVLVSLWGLRLGLHIFLRSRGKGEDFRYRAMRRKSGASFAWVSLFSVFFLQAGVLWVVSMPLWVAQRAAQPPGWTLLDGIGVTLFVIGFLFETIGDWQLTRFKRDAANAGKVLSSGLWRYTRHPNYFGDAVVWWGLFCLGLSTPGSWWTVISPALMTLLLMRVSGVTMLEATLEQTKPGYRDYIRRTNAFFPWFPRSTD